MDNAKTSIMAREIMDRDFPIVDVSVPLIKCVKKMNNKHEACIVMKNGNFSGVLGQDDILRGFMYGRDREAKIEDIRMRKNFKIINPESDVYKTLLLMKKDKVDFVLVKDNKNFLGLITKKEIADIEPLLFDEIAKPLM